MIGQQGIPAKYGGVERAVEELSARLVARGHEVTVFNPLDHAGASVSYHRGIELVPVRSLSGKFTGNLTQSLAGVAKAVRNDFDVVHFHAMGPCVWTPISKAFGGAAVVATIQGRDDQRAKWGWVARQLLGGAAWLSARMPDEVITVSRALRRSYMEDFGRESTYIPNGATPLASSTESTDTGVRDRFGLTDKNYVINVARIVPEKALDIAIQAFRQVETDHRFVIVGGSAGTADYENHLRSLAAGDDRIVFTGPIYGDELVDLVHHADSFLTASRLEGLPLALLEAIDSGLPVIVSDIEPHVEVVGSDGPAHRVFRTGDVSDLARVLKLALAERSDIETALGGFRARVAEEFSWDRITTTTEDVYRRACGDAPVADTHSSGVEHAASQRLLA